MPDYSETELRNIASVNRMFEAPRDFDRATLFADDAVWWNGLPMVGRGGRTEHKGIDEIRAILRGSGGQGGARTAETGVDPYDKATFRFEDVVVLADGDWAMRQHTMHSTTIGGQAYTNVYCFVYRFNDEGLIQYLTEHWNTWHAERVLFGNYHVEPAHPGT
ncbi:nuclear transport factor 2 family protein [Streptodolium elevatio]